MFYRVKFMDTPYHEQSIRVVPANFFEHDAPMKVEKFKKYRVLYTIEDDGKILYRYAQVINMAEVEEDLGVSLNPAQGSRPKRDVVAPKRHTQTADEGDDDDNPRQKSQSLLTSVDTKKRMAKTNLPSSSTSKDYSDVTNNINDLLKTKRENNKQGKMQSSKPKSNNALKVGVAEQAQANKEKKKGQTVVHGASAAASHQLCNDAPSEMRTNKREVGNNLKTTKQSNHKNFVQSIDKVATGADDAQQRDKETVKGVTASSAAATNEVGPSEMQANQRREVEKRSAEEDMQTKEVNSDTEEIMDRSLQSLRPAPGDFELTQGMDNELTRLNHNLEVNNREMKRNNDLLIEQNSLLKVIASSSKGFNCTHHENTGTNDFKEVDVNRELLSSTDKSMSFVPLELYGAKRYLGNGVFLSEVRYKKVLRHSKTDRQFLLLLTVMLFGTKYLVEHSVSGKSGAKRMKVDGKVKVVESYKARPAIDETGLLALKVAFRAFLVSKKRDQEQVDSMLMQFNGIIASKIDNLLKGKQGQEDMEEGDHINEDELQENVSSMAEVSLDYIDDSNAGNDAQDDEGQNMNNDEDMQHDSDTQMTCVSDDGEVG